MGTRSDTLQRLVSTPPTRGAGQWEKKLELGQAHGGEERGLASGGKLYTDSPMVSAGGSHPPVNPWVSVVPSPVCKPLVTSAPAHAGALDPVEEFALCFHDSGRPAGQALHH